MYIPFPIPQEALQTLQDPHVEGEEGQMPGDRATRTVLQVGGGVNARGSLGGSSHPLCLTPALGFQALVFFCVGMCWEVRGGLGRLEHTVGALPDIIPPSKPLLSLPVSLPLLLSLSASTFPLLLSPSLPLSLFLCLYLCLFKR